MKEYTAKDIRNVALVGHGSEGKTVLAEAMLLDAGVISRMGKTTDGTTAMDFDAEEIKRGFSISLALAALEWKNTKINVIDVPGYFDMVGEMHSALRVVENALIFVNSVNGVSVGSEKAFALCGKYGVSPSFFVNQMDREHANFGKVLDEMKEKFGTEVSALQYPIVDGGFKGYVDIITQKAYTFNGKNVTETAIPGDLADTVEELREALIENAAGADEELMEKYFEEGTLSDEDLLKGVKRGIAEGTVMPVFCGSGMENLNVTSLLDSIVSYLPSPADKDCGDESAPLSAFVFKTLSDNFVGKISFLKICSGKLSATDTPFNNTTEKTEKLNGFATMVGKNQIAVTTAHAGDICVLTKLASTNTGDTLTAASAPKKFDAIDFPAPSIGFAVSADKQGEEDKVFGGLARLQEEDPTFRVVKGADTGETLIEGQGELHLDIIVSKLAAKFNVKAKLSDPKIPYRETIRKPVRVQGRHKKQSGGHGQFGDIWVEFEPLTDGTEFEFVDKVVGGSVPRQYIPAVEKGLRDCIKKGVLAGYPVVGLKASLVDGSYHPVDSSEMAFKTAASLAFKKGCAEASPVLLEPIYKVEVIIPDEYMGDIIGDLNRRRGRIMGMNPVSGGQQVVAEVPQTEMFKYATDLRSMTQARGSFTMTFERYDEMPANMAQKVIEAAKVDEEEE